MPDIFKIYGPPGCGKTEHLLRIVEDAIRKGTPPERIAFMAFTKKAADEAAGRAISKFHLDKEQLPWFRTLHSMAFKILGVRREDIMQDEHYKELGYELGFQFSDLDSISFVPAGTTLGDKVARMESLSRLRCVSLEQQWADCNYHDVEISTVHQWDAGVRRFKATKGMLDYTDLLEQFDTALDIDLFILDEAQDLPPLQWQVVHKAAAHCKSLYCAADDDQAVFTWAGADPKLFIDLPGQSHILPQSFRIPRQVQKIAQSVLQDISNRQQKEWKPREAEGAVEYVMHEDSLDLSQGTWLLLARNHMHLSRFETIAINQGYPYMKEGTHSTDGPVARAILSWEKWRKNQPIDAKEIKNLGRYLPQLQGWVPRTASFFTESPASQDLLQFPWFDTLQISPKKREYIRSCLANKESLFGKPRITISTIHRAKGGEADHVALITDVTQNPWNQLNTDEEKRVLYVGLTRAKETLTIIQPASLRHYNL